MLRKCPKLPNAVCFGVGAAFDMHAGRVPRAPEWMQRSGTEWVHRLSHEPRRLARRYSATTLRFLVRLLGEELLRFRPH